MPHPLHPALRSARHTGPHGKQPPAPRRPLGQSQGQKGRQGTSGGRPHHPVTPVRPSSTTSSSYSGHCIGVLSPLLTNPLLFSFSFFRAAPCGMRDLSSPTRDRTHAPCSGSAVLTTGPPGKSLLTNPLEGWVHTPSIFRSLMARAVPKTRGRKKCMLKEQRDKKGLGRRRAGQDQPSHSEDRGHVDGPPPSRQPLFPPPPRKD